LRRVAVLLQEAIPLLERASARDRQRATMSNVTPFRPQAPDPKKARVREGEAALQSST
jgi:hypothetical protein